MSRTIWSPVSGQPFLGIYKGCPRSRENCIQHLLIHDKIKTIVLCFDTRFKDIPCSDMIVFNMLSGWRRLFLPGVPTKYRESTWRETNMPWLVHVNALFISIQYYSVVGSDYINLIARPSTLWIETSHVLKAMISKQRMREPSTPFSATWEWMFQPKAQ